MIPGAGYVTTQAAGNLGWADLAPYRSRNEYPNISDEWQKDSKQVGAPVPTAPVDVLVADNTVWGIPKVDRFGVLDTAGATKNATTNSNIGGGIRAVTYLGSLAASLAEATDTATTVGYSNYNARFNYDLDSLPARRATATSALQMSIMKANNSIRGEFTAATTGTTAVSDVQYGTMARCSCKNVRIECGHPHEAVGLCEPLPATGRAVGKYGGGHLSRDLRGS